MPNALNLNGQTVTIPASEVASAPRYPTRDAAKLAKVAWINTLTQQILGQYPEAVRQLWPEEEALAREYDDDPVAMPASRKSLLNRDAVAKGRTIAEHAAKIIANADLFRMAALEIRALSLATDKALDDAFTPDDWEAEIEAARVQATALAPTFGLTV